MISEMGIMLLLLTAMSGASEVNILYVSEIAPNENMVKIMARTFQMFINLI